MVPWAYLPLSRAFVADLATLIGFKTATICGVGLNRFPAGRGALESEKAIAGANQTCQTVWYAIVLIRGTTHEL